LEEKHLTLIKKENTTTTENNVFLFTKTLRVLLFCLGRSSKPFVMCVKEERQKLKEFFNCATLFEVKNSK
jgi:hypothetical protein